MKQLLIVMVAASTMCAAAKDWFVSKTGNDETGDGSAEAPFATVNKARDYLINNNRVFDTIVIGAGTYVCNRLAWNAALKLKGATGNAEDVVLDFDGLNNSAGAISYTGGGVENLTISNTVSVALEVKSGGGNNAYVTNVIVRGVNATTAANGIVNIWRMENGTGIKENFVHNLRIENCTCRGQLGGLMRVYPNAHVDNVVMTNCIVSGNSLIKPIGEEGEEVVFTDCKFIDCYGELDGGGTVLRHNNFAGLLVTMRGCEFIGNKVQNGNSAVLQIGNGGKLHMEGCTFSGNENTKSGTYATCFAFNLSNDAASELYATNCVFTGNNGYSGGVAYMNGGPNTTATFEDCVFSQNDAVQSAGVISANGSTALTVKRCQFIDNGSLTSVVDGGGALAFWAPQGLSSDVRWNFSDCLFKGNKCGGHGGAMVLPSNAFIKPSFVRCNFEGNESAKCGGALGSSNGDANNGTYNLEVSECVFKGNKAGNVGGAVSFRTNNGDADNSLVRLRNSLFVNNSAAKNGGAVYLVAGTKSSMENCTVVSNSTAMASGQGAGIYHRWGMAVINSIITYNKCAGDVYETGNFWQYANGYSYSLEYPASSSTNFKAANNCLTVEPKFDAEFKPAGRNSPLVNAATTLDWMSDATDLAGNARIFGAAPDIGCYERTTPLGTSINIR